jgi:hypothetical protein
MGVLISEPRRFLHDAMPKPSDFCAASLVRQIDRQGLIGQGLIAMG